MLGRLHLISKLRKLLHVILNLSQDLVHKILHRRLRNDKKRAVTNPKSIAILTIGLFLGLGLAYFFLLRGNGASANWYHDSWGFRRKITIDNTKVSGSSDLNNFAVLVSFSSDSTISANAKTDGSDILFTDSKGHQLTHEIEYYSAGTLVTWVRIPTLSTSVDTVIYMYYGNPTASGLENETAVWSSDYRGVWHLSETSGQHLDSTSNNNDSTSVSVTTQGSATGKVGGASDFASGNEVVIADSDSLDITSSFTAQAWVKADTIGGSGTWNSIIYKGGNSNYFLELTNSDELDAGFYGGGDWRGVTTTNSPVSTSSFYHVAVVHDAAGDTIKTFVNGVEKGSVSSITQTPLVNTSTFTIGENFYNESFDGIIDEVRLSDSPKSVDWLITEYNNQNSPSTFYSASHQEVRTRGPAAYWKFDEGHGTTVNDSSGNSITGTVGTGSSAPTWVNEEYCMSGKCLEYDGTDDYLSFGDSLDFDDGQDFTFSAWIKSNSFSTVQTVFAKKLGNSAGQVGYLINIGTGGTLNFYAADGTDQIWKGSGMPMSANTWYHIAFVFDEDNASNIAFYINGTATAGNLTGTLANLNSLSNVQSLGLGIEPDRQYVFNGFIDEAKIYTYARTAEEIKQDYLFASAKGASAVLGTRDASFMSDGLVGYWKLDESASGECSEFIDGVTYIDDACDSSGNQQSGIWGGDTAATTGKYGNAVSFDGTGDNVDLGDLSVTEGASQLTWSFWVKPTSLTTADILLGKTNTGTQFAWGISTAYADVNDLVCSIPTTTTDANTYGYTTNDVLSNGTWTYVTCVFDGTASGNSSRLKMYINGENQTLTYSGTVPSSTQSTTSNARIASTANDQLFFNGVIDEVRIYERALSQTEVKSLYESSPGPVAYWDFDENAGTTANDNSGNGNEATFSGSPSWDTGKYGSSLRFDGASNYLTASGSLLNAGVGSFTVSAWVKYNGTASSQDFIIHKWDSGVAGGYGLNIQSDGTLRFGIEDDGSSFPEDSATSVARYDDGKWHYVTGVKTGTSRIDLYVDGVVVASDTSISSTNTLDNNNPLYIGSRYSASQQWDGWIDELKIYNYARTQEQILEDINAGHPAVGTPVGSTVLHTKFNEGYGTTAHDSSSLGNDGTLGTGSSAPSWSNDGKFGKALSFDGNDYVDFGDNDDLKLTFPFTISAWVNINELPADEYSIISKWYSFTNDREYAFQIVGDNRLRFGFSSTGSDSEFAYADTAFSSADFDQWVHVVLTADVDRNYTFYRNGEEDGSGTFALTSIANDTASAMIGAVHYSNSLPSRFFKGKIDEVKLYPFDLNSEQVKTEYNGGKTMILGAKSTGVGGTSPSNSAGREYCVPGDTSTCNAPVAEWLFNEGIGNTANDTSGNGNSGSMSGPDWTSGKRGKALNFDGVGDQITVTDSNSLDTGTNTTWSLWFKMDTLPSVAGYSYRLLDKWVGTGNQRSFQLYVATTNKIHMDVDPDGTDVLDVDIAGNDTLSTNTWYHVSVVVNGSQGYMFVNGVKQSDIENVSGVYSGTANLFIGSDTSANYFDGVIDDIRIYNYARTPAQIAWEYNRGAPVAQYKFDECQGITVYNSALNGDGKAAGNNGTITIGGSGTTSVGNCSTSNTAWGNGESGKINSSLDFDGTDDYTSVTDAPQLSFGNGTTDKPFSVTAWIKMDDATDFQFVSKLPASGVLSNLEWALGVGVTDRLGLRLYDNSALVYIGKYSDATLTQYEGQWVHVAFTYDGSESGNGISLFVNGAEVAGTSESAGSYAGMEDTASDLRIGAIFPSDATYKKFANGKIDDLRIYNYELTDTQIRDSMNNGAITFR